MIDLTPWEGRAVSLIFTARPVLDASGVVHRQFLRITSTDTKLIIYGLFQKGRVLAQDGIASPSFLATTSRWHSRRSPGCCTRYQ